MQQVISSEPHTTATPATESELAAAPEPGVTFADALALAMRLSPVDKARLIVHLSSVVQQVLQGLPVETKPPQFLGIWSEVNITEEDIAEARREMWGNFPREDI